MTVLLEIRNESRFRERMYRGDTLRRLAERVCEAEGAPSETEVSLLLCDDGFIQRLNAGYRDQDRPTDVLSFAQPGMAGLTPVPLGDIVISLETVRERCDTAAEARREVKLLFCHGLLHLLGYTHGCGRDRERMAEKQAEYLGMPPDEAWLAVPDPPPRKART